MPIHTCEHSSLLSAGVPLKGGLCASSGERAAQEQTAQAWE
jgi:hypothetical protein